MSKQPNPNAGLNARKRRILRAMQSRAYESIHPIRSERRVDDNDKIFKFWSYRTEIITKDPETKLAVLLAGLSWTRLLRRKTQAEHALSRAQARHDKATTPAMRAVLFPQVSRCKDFLAAVQTEIDSRPDQRHAERLADLTPREIKHKLHHGHQARERASLRRDCCAPVAVDIRTREHAELCRRNVTLTTALRAKEVKASQ